MVILNQSADGRGGRRGAFTLLELLVTIAIIIILVALVLPAIGRSMGKARQIECLSRLRQIGLAMNSFAHDHNGHFPMQVPNPQGGSMWESRTHLPVSRLLSYSPRHFQVLSNELSSPKIAVCPADKKKEASNFNAMSPTQISFWVFYPASPGISSHPLAGDWNVRSVTTNRSIAGSRTNLLTIRFDERLHQSRGNIVFADGHVELVRNIDLPPETGPNNFATRPTTTANVNPNNPVNPNAPNPIPTGNVINNPRPIVPNAGTILKEPSTPPGKVLEPSSPAATNTPPIQSPTNSTLSTNYQSDPAAAAATKQLPGVAINSPQEKSSAPPYSEPGSSSATVKEDETEDTDDRLKQLRQMQNAIKLAFLLGLLLTILGFIWSYLHRRKRDKQKAQEENQPEPVDPNKADLDPTETGGK